MRSSRGRCSLWDGTCGHRAADRAPAVLGRPENELSAFGVFFFFLRIPASLFAHSANVLFIAARPAVPAGGPSRFHARRAHVSREVVLHWHRARTVRIYYVIRDNVRARYTDQRTTTRAVYRGRTLGPDRRFGVQSLDTTRAWKLYANRTARTKSEPRDSSGDRLFPGPVRGVYGHREKYRSTNRPD